MSQIKLVFLQDIDGSNVMVINMGMPLPPATYIQSFKNYLKEIRENRSKGPRCNMQSQRYDINELYPIDHSSMFNFDSSYRIHYLLVNNFYIVAVGLQSIKNFSSNPFLVPHIIQEMKQLLISLNKGGDVAVDKIEKKYSIFYLGLCRLIKGEKKEV